jgi:cytoskeletal protein RodZ
MYEGEESNFDAAPPEESSNRTFVIAAGILGGIVLLSIACLAGYALLIAPQQRQAAQAAADAKATQDAQINSALTSTFEASILPTTTLTPSPTSVIAQATATSTQVSTPTPDPSTATVAAALTQAAVAQLTVVATSTALPGTGIADEYGLPGLVVMAMAFMVVILLARRLRATPAK